MMNQNIKNKISAPILFYFEIEGLNGYKNIKITLERNVKIISTENGAGKTTLLNMLYSLLSGKVNRLQRIDFKKFTLKINKKDITYSKKQLFPQPIDSEKIRFPFPAGRFIYDVLSKEDIHELLNLYATDYNANFWKHKNIQKLLSDTPLETNDIKEIFEEKINSIYESSEDLLKLKKEIKENLNEITILYLPTYRRIEADLSEFDNSIFIERNRRYHNFRRAQAENIESEQLIYFGLEDVEKRLNNITKEIRDATFEAYSRINARHLDQLVNIGIKNNHKKIEKEQISTIKVALARVGKSNTETEKKIVNLIESGEINNPQYEQLEIHLNQLIEIYQEKSNSDQIIEDFINVVNSYLGNENSEKKFIFNKLTVDVQVINRHTNKTLHLNALSSGEKQIVSIFNRLYLDKQKQYLILIDEPELSLSLEWQKKFLPDILNTPSCKQLIAITHSPFIFDNELDQYAGSLDISYNEATNE